MIEKFEKISEGVSNNPRDYRPAPHEKITYVTVLPKFEEIEKPEITEGGILIPKSNNPMSKANERLGIVEVPSINSILLKGDIVAFDWFNVGHSCGSASYKYDKEYLGVLNIDLRRLIPIEEQE